MTQKSPRAAAIGYDLIDALECALKKAQDVASPLTAHIIRMAILNETGGLLYNSQRDGQA